MDRRQFIAACSAAATAALAGCSAGGGADVVETTDVTMADDQFDPRNIAVDAGATVTWTNEDDDGHTVTSASDNWELDETVSAGGETTHTFEEDGVYDVYCRFHGTEELSGMSMKVAVGDAEIDSPLASGDDGGGAYG